MAHTTSPGEIMMGETTTHVIQPAEKPFSMKSRLAPFTASTMPAGLIACRGDHGNTLAATRCEIVNSHSVAMG